MPLPEGFNEWEFLQDTLRLWHNKSVAEWFRNQEPNDISTPRAALRHACTMKDNDTSTMTMIRLWLYEITAGHAQSIQAPIYGIPVADYQADVAFRPQVKLTFKERYTINTDRDRPSRGEISFRLMNETGASYTRAKAVLLAAKIKNEFANPIFVWGKGKFYYYYKDLERGYWLKLLVKNKAEGERITKSVLSIQNHTFSTDYTSFSDPDRNFPLNPGTHLIYGRQTKKPVRRPTADVRFRHAQLFINGRLPVINLVSTPESALRSVIERVNLA